MSIKTKKTNQWISGLMLDTSRIIEKKGYYLKLIPYLKQWGYNSFFYHFADDNGTSFPFESHPELTNRYTLTRKDNEELLACAQKHGIEVIPEVESLGHTGYITNIKQYDHLHEQNSGAQFKALCPSRKESRSIVEDLIRETARFFPSPYIHAGLDEAPFGECPSCRATGKEEWELFVDHVNRLYSIITSEGKKMLIWGDHLLSEPRIAKNIPKDIIVCHWKYKPDITEDSMVFLLNQGFKVISCPSIACYLQAIHPNIANIINSRKMISYAAKYRSKGVLGVANTIWCPQRYLSGSIVFGMIFCGQLSSSYAKEDRKAVARNVGKYYGMRASTTLSNLLYEVHQSAIINQVFQKIIHLPNEPKPELTDYEKMTCEHALKENKQLLTKLRKLKIKITKNKTDFEDVLLACEAAIIVCRIGLKKPVSITTIKKFLKRITASWKRTRHASMMLNIPPITVHGSFFARMHTLLKK